LLYDVGGTGYVNAFDFKVACRELNLFFSDGVHEELIKRFCQPGNPGMVNYEDFLEKAREKLPRTEPPDYSNVRHQQARLSSDASDDNLQANNVEQWYLNKATPAQKHQFENLYESIRDFRETQPSFPGHKPDLRQTTMLPKMNLQLDLDKVEADFSRSRHTSRTGTMPIQQMSPIRSPMQSSRRQSHTTEMMYSPVGSAGASIWGKHNKANKGQVPSWAKKSNYWMCAVCFYTENPSNTPECEICRSTNPESRGAEVIQQCSKCTFQNEEYAVECEMCGEKLHYGASSSRRKEQQQFIQGKRLLPHNRQGARFGEEEDNFFGAEAFPLSNRYQR